MGNYGTEVRNPVVPKQTHGGLFIASGVPVGERWAGVKASGGGGVVAWEHCDTGCSTNESGGTFFSAKDRYLLMEFTGGHLRHNIYGWAQLAVSFPNCTGCVDVTLVDYAYDTSGKEVPAGDTGTPEPSTLVTTGLAALALGAKGLRAWRAARRGAIMIPPSTGD
jgi:hypothetical protein